MPERFKAGVSFKDKANSDSTVEWYTNEAALLAYATNPANPGLIHDLQDAIAAMSLATMTKEFARVEDAALIPILPTDDQAYNSSKLAITYVDDVTGDTYTSTIPARNPANYNTAPGTKVVLLTVAQGGTAQTEALVAAWNTGARTKGGNPSTILRIQIAGRKQGGA